jgi:hypothetical protein
MAQNSTYNVAQNTVYLDSTHPSCIILPEIAQQALNIKTNNIVYEENSGFLRNIFKGNLGRLLENRFNFFFNKILDPFLLG